MHESEIYRMRKNKRKRKLKQKKKNEEHQMQREGEKFCPRINFLLLPFW